MMGIKNYIKTHYINGNHPIMLYLWYRLKTRKMLARQERASRMSYAQIEAEINRQYEQTFGRKLDWDNPKSYNEKIHVSKVYMPSELKTRLADKVAVRDWIAGKIGKQYLIPLLGVYETFDEIDFDALPDKFVIKCSHDSGSVTLVKDKSKADIEFLRQYYNFWLKRIFCWYGFEMHYREIKPKIVIEQYMGDAINDYKFLCFDGKPYYCWVDFDRYTNHKRNIYNLDWELQPFNQYHYGNYDKPVPCPERFSKMKEIVTELCKGFEHVRTDLYLIDGKIYFGEMTFSNGDGFEEITPDEWAYKLGELWPFDTSIRRQVLSHQVRP